MFKIKICSIKIPYAEKRVLILVPFRVANTVKVF